MYGGMMTNIKAITFESTSNFNINITKMKISDKGILQIGFGNEDDVCMTVGKGTFPFIDDLDNLDFPPELIE